MARVIGTLAAAGVIVAGALVGYGQTGKPGGTVGGAGAGSPSAASAPAEVDLTILNAAVESANKGDRERAEALIKTFEAGLSRKGMNTDPNWINSNHVLGVAYMRAGEMAKAKGPMEFVMNGGKQNRSTVLNVAMLDIVQKTNVMRAVKKLQTYAVAHPEDELGVNLLGMAIKVAGETMPKVDLTTQKGDLERANGLLEKTKPGKKHWGSDWMDEGAFEPIGVQRRREQRLVDDAKGRMASATKKLGDLNAQLQADTRQVIGISAEQQGNRERDANDVKLRLEGAQRDMERAKGDYDRAMSELPQPDWTVKLEPVAIELVN